MAHTKGPWKVVFGNIVGADNKGIFHQSVMLENVKTVGEMEANARLIASAPELLEALKNVISDHKERIKLYPKRESQPNRIAVMEKAIQAISKAEGKE